MSILVILFLIWVFISTNLCWFPYCWFYSKSYEYFYYYFICTKTYNIEIKLKLQVSDTLNVRTGKFCTLSILRVLQSLLFFFILDKYIVFQYVEIVLKQYCINFWTNIFILLFCYIYMRQESPIISDSDCSNPKIKPIFFREFTSDNLLIVTLRIDGSD